MRNKLLQAVKSHAQGHIDKHIANVEVYLNQSVGIGEHSNIIEAIEMELEEISKYQDQIDILEKYFPLEKELQTNNGFTSTSTLG
jgi:histidinol phosphatase-like PHP family hydrolase